MAICAAFWVVGCDSAKVAQSTITTPAASSTSQLPEETLLCRYVDKDVVTEQFPDLGPFEMRDMQGGDCLIRDRADTTSIWVSTHSPAEWVKFQGFPRWRAVRVDGADVGVFASGVLTDTHEHSTDVAVRDATKVVRVVSGMASKRRLITDSLGIDQAARLARSVLEQLAKT